MSNEQDKFKHSRRLQKDKNAVAKQLKMAISSGITKYVEQPHRLEKHHAMDCGNPNCYMCGNPRYTMNEKTIQEQRFEQPEKLTVDPDSHN